MVQALTPGLPPVAANVAPPAAANPAPTGPATDDAAEGTADFAQSLQQAQRPATPRPAGKAQPQAMPPRPAVAGNAGTAGAPPAPGETGPATAASVPDDLEPSDPAATPEGTPPDLAALLAHLRGHTPSPPAAETASGTADAAAAGSLDPAQGSSPTPNARPALAEAGSLRAAPLGREQAAPNQAPAHPAAADERARFQDELARALPAQAGPAAEAPSTAAALPLPPAPTAAPAAPSLLPGSSPAAPAEAQLAARPGSEAFAPQFSAQISTFVRDGVEHARLHLNPAEMGPVTVQIQLDGQTAQVHLLAENGQTRQALEQAMPQLAGSLRDAGLTLTGGGVFQQPRQTGSDAGPNGRPGGRGTAAEARAAQAEALAPLAAPAAPRPRGVVDLIA